MWFSTLRQHTTLCLVIKNISALLHYYPKITSFKKTVLSARVSQAAHVCRQKFWYDNFVVGTVVSRQNRWLCTEKIHIPAVFEKCQMSHFLDVLFFDVVFLGGPFCPLECFLVGMFFQCRFLKAVFRCTVLSCHQPDYYFTIPNCETVNFRGITLRLLLPKMMS